MPFLTASGYAFPVSLTKSWHSAATTSAGDGERVSMMVTYYVADSFARRLYWRGRRGLFSAGFTGVRAVLFSRGESIRTAERLGGDRREFRARRERASDARSTGSGD